VNQVKINEPDAIHNVLSVQSRLHATVTGNHISISQLASRPCLCRPFLRPLPTSSSPTNNTPARYRGHCAHGHECGENIMLTLVPSICTAIIGDLLARQGYCTVVCSQYRLAVRRSCVTSYTSRLTTLSALRNTLRDHGSYSLCATVLAIAKQRCTAVGHIDDGCEDDGVELTVR
jgi:hypothetical protein